MTDEVQTLSAIAHERMLSLPREPLFIADWLDVVMIHLEVDAGELQEVTPFQLDLWHGCAFVTLVAVTLRRMHPRFGGKLGELVFRPLASHRFLNVRTYVRHEHETGIHFLAEWLDSKLAVQLGPRAFGLPYRLGRIEYENEVSGGRGRVVDARSGAALAYRADSEIGAPELAPCVAGSLDEWLMERYTAFNCIRARRRFFRVWHEPWLQARVQVELTERSLLTRSWPLFRDANLAGTNCSPGVRDVWMGWPHRVRGAALAVSTKTCCLDGVG